MFWQMRHLERQAELIHSLIRVLWLKRCDINWLCMMCWMGFLGFPVI